MTERSAWFCPACQKYHAPHCDSCPAQVVEVRPIPGVNVWPSKIIPETPAGTGNPPLPMGYWTAVDAYQFVFDPNTSIISN